MDGSNAGNAVSISSVGGVMTASWNTASLPVGAHTVTATYSGDDSFFGSNGASSSAQTVNKASASTVVAASTNPSVFGQGVTFSATVTASAPGNGTPTGTVQFQIDGSNLGSPVNLNGGQAVSVATSNLSVNGHTVKVVYSGDTNFTGNNATLTQTVSQATTKTGINSSVNAPVFGQSMSFTATVSVQNPGAGTPTGSVQFQIDGSNAGSPVPVSTSGGVTTAAFTISNLPVGSHMVRANYGGDTSFVSSGGAVTQTINKANTSTAVSSSLNPSYFSQTVVFTATVNVMPPGAGTPTGTVQFQIDGSNAGSAVSVNTSGGVTTASFSTSALTVATHTVTASYTGDGSFATSNGTLAGGEVVKPNGVTATLSSGIVSIASDPFNNAITMRQVTPGFLRVYGDPVSPPAMPTHVNGTDYAEFSLPSVSGISIQFADGNDSVTMTGFGISGDITISAGLGSDTFTLNAIAASGISVAATGADKVGMSSVTARRDLNITVGAGTQSVSVTSATALDLTIRAHSKAHDTVRFDLENDTITNANAGGLTVDDSQGAGNDGGTLSHINIAYGLAVTLGSGVNYVDADHVTALFGFIDGGEPNSGANAFTDYGGNVGFFVTHFIGH
jgi:hypothetical protein